MHEALGGVRKTTRLGRTYHRGLPSLLLQSHWPETVLNTDENLDKA